MQDTTMKTLEQDTSSTPRILCTGHKGFIGSHLTPRLKDWVGVDLKDGQNLLTCELPKNIHLIYHLAAQSSVEASWHDPLHDLDNIRITARLAHAYPKAKIVYVNSCASSSFSSSPYAFSKGTSEVYLYCFHKKNISLVLPNIYGPGSKSVVDLFKGQKSVTIYGKGDHTRTYVHVADVVDALLKAPTWNGQQYSLGGPDRLTVKDLAKGKKVTYKPARKEAPHVTVLNNTPNWKPKIRVKDYLK